VPSTQSLSNRSLARDPLISGAKGAPRSCPAGSIAEVGFMRRDAEPTPQQPMRVWPIREQPGNDNPPPAAT
jgi:hypothetical protein